MQAEERQQTILQMLQTRGQLAIADLSARFEVSEMTVRRDLAQLEKTGLLRRIHGGAARAGSGSFEPPFALRARLHTEAKRAIATAVAAELTDGQTVILDGGTTGMAVAEALVGRNLTVCALNMRVAEILASSPATRVMLPGGIIRHDELSLAGAAAERTLADHRFDTYVMTVSGIDTAAGLTEWNLDDAAVKRAALAVAGRCVVACDSSKFGQTAFARIAALGDVDVIITDTALAADQREAAAAGGADVRIA
ncbi:DeoR/GlpR family DNA-binding transcription regulator [Streptomyces sp. NPDC091281]|uniref:DeoR/GlpR family DNA-binding transcription regulator n=1 Tax=Streptomyces sp. NPDC091281 TaxID=3365985 RepID=UPI0038111A56